MKKFLLIIFLLTVLHEAALSNAVSNDNLSKISFWNSSLKKGANVFNQDVLREDIAAAKIYGI